MSSNFGSLPATIPPYPNEEWDDWDDGVVYEAYEGYEAYEDQTAVALYDGDLWADDPYAWPQPPAYPSQTPQIRLVLGITGLLIVLVLLGLLNVSGIGQVERIPAQTAVPPDLANIGRNSLYVADPFTVVAPYTNYTLTQGLHGQSYGHLAIDLAAGRGEPVRSPINGFVTNYYIDQYNNTTLVIENELFIVTLLHGDYTVGIGDELTAGQTVGSEGNNGYTMDYFGNLCYGRDWCGNHTHLNIYDKRIRSNISPLEFMQ